MQRSANLPLLLLVLILSLVGTPAQAKNRHHHAAGHVRQKAVASGPGSASLLMDANSGLILEERNADLPLHPASLTKTMTLLLTFEALERGSLRLGDPILISNHAAHMAPSKLDLPPGSSISVQNAIYAVVTHSANDIAVALAERLGGTEGRFAYLMNQRALELGMTHTHFVNACGLPDPQQLSSARDMAKLARYIITVHPQYYRVFATRQFIYRGLVYQNHNHLMETYPGMDGMKTGFTAQSGFNLIASAKHGNRRLIGVIFGGRSTASRNNEMAALLNQGFNQLNVSPQTSQRLAAVTTQTQPTLATPQHILGNEEESDPQLQKGAFSSASGEGDVDPVATQRLETGLLAIAAVRQQNSNGSNNAGAPATTATSVAPVSVPAKDNDIWAIQIGAYPSRVMTDQAIQHARLALPPTLAKADPIIVPLQTAQGVVFRGRLSGYRRDEAYAACKILINCTPVSPLAY